MKMTELKSKDITELESLLVNKQDEVAEVRTQLRTAEVKNVRQIRSLKKDIARIQTAKQLNASSNVKETK